MASAVARTWPAAGTTWGLEKVLAAGAADAVMGRARLNKADEIHRARRGEAGMCQRRPLPVSSMWTPQPSGLDSLGYERRGGYRRLPLTMRGVSPKVNTGFSGRWRRSNLTLSRPVGRSTQAHG